MEIRPFQKQDTEAVWRILKEIIVRGDSFAYSPDSTQEEMINYWCDKKKHTYVALLENKIVGTFFIQDNQPGLGSHVGNAGYAVAMEASGKGVGFAMGEFSLTEAKRLGYEAMQFNIVVKSNTYAVRLWTSLGFKIIGEIPDAFRHLQHGFTNAYIMHRKL